MIALCCCLLTLGCRSITLCRCSFTLCRGMITLCSHPLSLSHLMEQCRHSPLLLRHGTVGRALGGIYACLGITLDPLKLLPRLLALLLRLKEFMPGTCELGAEQSFTLGGGGHSGCTLLMLCWHRMLGIGRRALVIAGRAAGCGALGDSDARLRIALHPLELLRCPLPCLEDFVAGTHELSGQSLTLSSGLAFSARLGG